MREKLEELKEQAEKNNPMESLTNLVEIGDYLIGYCLEVFGSVTCQKTLSISRIDKKRPDFREVKDAIPDLIPVFMPNNRIAFFQRNYPNRGHTLVLVILDKENTDG